MWGACAVLLMLWVLLPAHETPVHAAAPSPTAVLVLKEAGFLQLPLSATDLHTTGVLSSFLFCFSSLHPSDVLTSWEWPLATLNH